MASGIYKRSKLVCGVGINDSNYTVSSVINGKSIRCPFYYTWTSMLARCYSKREQKRNPTYIGCTVSNEWLSFSAFSAWMNSQEWQGNQLDKDILIQSNKVYSSLTCLFVSSEINSLLNSCTANRGSYPRGVSFYKRRGQYRADCRAYGKKKTIGFYDSPQEASEAYKSFKYKYIAEIASQQSEPLRTALLNYVMEG